MKTQIAVLTLALLIMTTTAMAAPRNVYNIKVDGKNHLYSQVEAKASSKYFTKLPATVYRYWVANTPIRDTEHNRKLVMIEVKPAYMNNTVHIDFDHIVKLPLRGLCVPSNLTASFAIYFTIKNGFIHELVVGISIPEHITNQLPKQNHPPVMA